MSKLKRKEKQEKQVIEKMTNEELVASLQEIHEKIIKLREERESKNGKI